MEKNSADLFELMTKIYNDMNTGFNTINTRIDTLEAKINSLETNINNKLDTLTSDIGNLVSKDLADTISNQITKLNQDVKFIKRKVQDTEEDVFVIQDHLKLIK